MTRKDFILMSTTLRKVRDSYAPHWNPNLFRACDDHAKAFADALSNQTDAFDKERFLHDAGVKSP
jgi:hypothetical protein